MATSFEEVIYIPRSRDAWRIAYVSPRCEVVRMQADDHGDWHPVGSSIELYGSPEDITTALMCMVRAYDPEADGDSDGQLVMRGRLAPYLRH